MKITAPDTQHVELEKQNVEMRRTQEQLETQQIELELQNEELQHVREALEASRNKYAELYDFAPVSYFTFDTRGVIKEVNYSGVRLLGVEKQQLINASFANFIAGADGREIFSNHLMLVLQRKVILKCEIKVRGNDGETIDLLLHSVAIGTAENMDVHILTSMFDSTIRKQLEKKLQFAHDKLEEAVRERTSELMAANIQLTQEILERKKAEASLHSAYTEIKQFKDRLQGENIYLQLEVARQYNFGDIIGNSAMMSQVFTMVDQVASMNATVLLLGETGSGKGVVARAIHSCSTRKGRPLITVDCTTLPASLVESELFGRERGAFTGSDGRQIGRFELADGGTIFLDEIGEMPLELQGKLLRIIQDGEFERLGSPRTLKTDVRIIAATNRNLAEEVRMGNFREDLFYRLNVFPITLPSLRQRREDIPLLVNHFVAKFNKKIGKKIETISKDTLNTLQEYHWPGNVRELENVIERAVILSNGPVLQVTDRFDLLPKHEEQGRGQDVRALIELEHDHVLQVLQKTGWRIEGKNGAAVILGLNPSTLRARMRKYGISRQ